MNFGWSCRSAEIPRDGYYSLPRGRTHRSRREAAIFSGNLSHFRRPRLRINPPNSISLPQKYRRLNKRSDSDWLGENVATRHLYRSRDREILPCGSSILCWSCWWPQMTAYIYVIPTCRWLVYTDICVLCCHIHVELCRCIVWAWLLISGTLATLRPRRSMCN